MKFFISAVLEFAAVLIATVIVTFCANKFFDSQFTTQTSGKEISIAQAAGICEMGEIVNDNTMVDFSKRLFGIDSETVITLSPKAMDFINDTKVSGTFANYFHFFIPVSLLTGFICLVAGIGFPFRWNRGTSLVDVCDDAVGANPLNKYTVTYLDENNRWREYTSYEGEGKSCLLQGFMLILYLFLIIVWGSLIIPILLINLCVAAIILAVGIIANICKRNSSNAAKKADE